MSFDRRPLLDLARAQHGLVTRADVHRLLPGAWPRRALLEEGTLVAVGRRTFRVAGTPSTPEQRALLAVLDTGGALSHRSAAWLHGIPGFELADRPEVTVPGGRIPSTSSVAHLHTSTWLPADDRIEVRSIPALSVARTLFSLASVLDEGELRGAVDDAVRLGLATDRWLWWRLERLRARGRDGVSAFEALLRHRVGGAVTESWLEREYLALLVRAQLPVPALQRRIRRRGAFVARVDFAYDDVPLIQEVLGFTHHASERQLVADAERRNALQLAGFTVLEFLSDDIVNRPSFVVRTVVEARATLAARRRSA